MKKTSRRITLILLAGLLLAACRQSTSSSTPEATRDASASATPRSTRTPASINIPQAAIEAFGQIAPVRSVELSFGASGEVGEVLASVGGLVEADDVIARLRDDALQANISKAEASLAEAQARAAQLPQQVADAEAELRTAQARLADLNAKRNVNSELLAAEANLAEAESRQQQAQTRYDRILARGELGEIEEQARRDLEEAIKKTDVARARLAELQPGSQSDMADSAQVSAAYAVVKAAKAKLDQLMAESSGEVVGITATGIQQAQAALDFAKAQLEQTVIRAPFAGTIARADLVVGGQAREGERIITLADFSQWKIETDNLAETDITRVKVGQPVTITLDALPGVKLRGEVASIGLVFQSIGNRITYPVTIKLIDNDPRLRWGMTASVVFDK